MEAIIGAVYLAEGLEGATRLVMSILGTRLATAQTDGADHKSRFQELAAQLGAGPPRRSEEHTSELQSLMRISYAVFCLKKKNNHINHKHSHPTHNRDSRRQNSAIHSTQL